MNQNPYGDPPIPVDLGENTVLGSPLAYRPAPSDAEIEAARAAKSRRNFKDWLDKRTAQAQGDPSAPVDHATPPYFSRAARREGDRKAPLPNGLRRLYHGGKSITGASMKRGGEPA